MDRQNQSTKPNGYESVQAIQAQNLAGQNQSGSQYAQNNNYYQASMLQGGGVKQYGAQYVSGKQDEDIGQSYYQAQNNADIQSQYKGSQYGGANQYRGASQYNATNQYPGSAAMNTLNNVSSNQFSNSGQYGQSKFRITLCTQFAPNNNYYQASMLQGEWGK